MKTQENIFHAINPKTGEALENVYSNTSIEDINNVVNNATKAFNEYKKKDAASIANFLNQIAEEILNLGDALLERTHLESGLPLGRLQGERGRTMGQLKLFASVVKEGSWVDARIDKADPNRQPFPKSDIRHMLTPLGPVAVFGASNFPLAFSVAGGDTASALAAGCPVVVKGHPAHPGTSEMVANAIAKAITVCNMPKNTFTLIQGNTNLVGETLVKHPGIKAVGFTGSFGGGKALFDIANSRPEPIPVFAEMGSTNPVFILPEKAKENGASLATGLVNSIALGVGQFCTNPGLVFVEKNESSPAFFSQLKNDAENVEPATMLTPNIHATYTKGVEKIYNTENVELVASGKADNLLNGSSISIFKTNAENFNTHKALAEENFGPSSIMVEASSKDDILDIARNLSGHLTATVHGTESDLKAYNDLISILEEKVGRIIINGYPTGVEVCHAMVHGGPYPSTTAPQSTSVGTNAIKRFARPVCYQDFHQFMLPEALKNENSLGIWRLIDGTLSKDKID